MKALAGRAENEMTRRNVPFLATVTLLISLATVTVLISAPAGFHVAAC